MADQQKDIIYIDLEDEITSIIDKLHSSPHKIVALVLPKRASMLQSIVNMRLLKRTAEDAKKRIVLITSEANILPLAGAVGVHVAKTLQTKPYLPEPPDKADASALTVDDNNEGGDDASEVDRHKSVGELAGLPTDADDETIEVGDSETDSAPKKKTKSKSKIKIPNFDRFRNRFVLGGVGLVLLIALWFWAFVVAPKALIVIKTDNTSFASNLPITASLSAKELNKDSGVVPAENRDFKKTDAVKVPATGEKDLGTKASGKMTLKNCTKTDGAITIPAGTAATSGSFAFLTQTEVVLPASVFSGGGVCLTPTKDVNVTAKEAGDKYNLSPRNYTLSGYSSVSASGSAMTGGTSNIVKVVSQQDVDGAKQKVLDQNLEIGKDEVSKILTTGGFLPIPDSLSSGNPVVTSSPNVGEQASEANVSLTITYTMTGAKLDALKQLIENDAKKHIDTNKQTILDNGLDKAVLRDVNKQSNGDVKLTLQVEVIAGVAQDTDSIKKAIIGKKKGDAQNTIASRPGVKEVNISYSPFWVFTTPRKASKITVRFEQTQNVENTNTNSTP